jgi:hypothetical protein
MFKLKHKLDIFLVYKSLKETFSLAKLTITLNLIGAQTNPCRTTGSTISESALETPTRSYVKLDFILLLRTFSCSELEPESQLNLALVPGKCVKGQSHGKDCEIITLNDILSPN